MKLIICCYQNRHAPNPGQLTSREGFSRDAGHRGLNPGCPAKSGTSGNPTFDVSNADRNFYENSLETFCTINFWSWRTSNFPLTVMLILAKKGLRLAIFYLLILPVTPDFFSVFRMPNGWTTFVQFMKKSCRKFDCIPLSLNDTKLLLI